MSDEQDQAEALDDDKLGNDPGADPSGDDAPAQDYPPDQPLGVDDPQVVGNTDDLATRVLREQPEPLADEPPE